MEPGIVKVTTHQEITALVEGAFGASGIVQAVTPSVEAARDKLQKTVLRDMVNFAESLPANWSGMPVSEEGLAPPDRSHFIEARKEFARDISKTLAHGLTTVSLGWLSNKASITFPVYLGAGTGEAAAHLVATTLAAQGVASTARGTQVTFALPSHERRALKEFKDAVNDVVKARKEFFETLASQ